MSDNQEGDDHALVEFRGDWFLSCSQFSETSHYSSNCGNLL